MVQEEIDTPKSPGEDLTTKIVACGDPSRYLSPCSYNSRPSWRQLRQRCVKRTWSGKGYNCQQVPWARGGEKELKFPITRQLALTAQREVGVTALSRQLL